MLTAVESNVFAALRHHACGTCAAADDGSNRRAFTATRNHADDRADTRSRANFRRVILRRIASFDAAFRIDLRIVLALRTRGGRAQRLRCRIAPASASAG